MIFPLVLYPPLLRQCIAIFALAEGCLLFDIEWAFLFLIWDANCFFPPESKDCMTFASYEYRNTSARRGAQLMPIWMPTTCWKTFPKRPRKCCRLETLACWLCHPQCTCFLNQNVPWRKIILRPRPKTKTLYLQFPCVGMKEFRMIVASLLLSFWWGIGV